MSAEKKPRLEKPPKLNLADGHEEAVFEGKGGLEAEAFVRAIRQKAFREGRQDADRWIAQFAATCFIGDALRWHASLDDDVQNSWKALQRAMFTQYPAPKRRNIRRESLPAPIPRKGRIRVQLDDTGTIAFVSRTVGRHGQYFTTNNSSNALQVECDPSDGSKRIKLLNPTTEHDWLGISWDETPTNWGLGSPCWAVVVGVNRSNRKSMLSTSSRCEGPTKAVTWDIASDGGLVPIWEREDGEQYPLEATMQVSSSKTGTLVLVFDYNSFSSLQDRPYHRARLVFESL
ncbi:hypothetical protein M407DRAFT_119055 [Tulasnella calospora MUT 4182]|uniref:Uncharacterized protein n=1 Tax=Tulasnella calospora MUT 4182 TaxID=1051891 RepID=A0A0C3Q1Z3_9AGAM|nr:hypothetical protein M407DRAFT_119055 [Tulasnella calospora MUT 4182]